MTHRTARLGILSLALTAFLGCDNAGTTPPPATNPESVTPKVSPGVGKPTASPSSPASSSNAP